MKILHLSDLHFGTERPNIREAVAKAIDEINPHLTVISGDFTQVAIDEEFEMARDFIKSFKAPVFSVPGNHDVPRYDLIERFVDPYKKFRDYIQDDLQPYVALDGVVMAGINSARRMLPHWNWANGAISNKQLQYLDDTFRTVQDCYKICVFHHPIHKAVDMPLKVTVFGAKKAMEKIDELNIDLVLTGHVHHASVTTVKNTVYCSAATALSYRTRTQDNGFNVIEFGDDGFEIRHYGFKDNVFNQATHSFHKRVVR